MSAVNEEVNYSTVPSIQLKRINFRGRHNPVITLSIPPEVLIRSYEMLGLSLPELLKHRQVCKVFELALMQLRTYVEIWSRQQDPPDETDSMYSSCQTSAFVARLALVAHLVRGPLGLSFGENSPLSDCVDVHTTEHGRNATDLYSACASFAHLETINARGNFVTDKLVHALMRSNATTLRELDLSAVEDNISYLTNDGLMTIATNCKHLTTIKLSNQYWLTDNSVTTLFKNNRNLEIVELNTIFTGSTPSESLTDVCLIALGKSCSLLRVLHIKAHSFTDFGLCMIAMGCRNLEDLDLSMPMKSTSISQYTNHGCSMIAVGCPRLKRIILNGCKKLSDECIISLYTHCPLLDHFDLQRTNITDSLIRELARALGPKLRYLNVRGCKKLTDMAEYFVWNNCHNVVFKNDHGDSPYGSETSYITMAPWYLGDTYGLGYGRGDEDDDY